MELYLCPLCCTQKFSSITALHEHLMYYIYRPLMCVICASNVSGIYELIRHLEAHILGAKSTEDLGCQLLGKEYYFNTDERIQDLGNSDNYVRIKHADIPSEDIITKHQSEVLDISLNLTHAFICRKCGERILDKNKYFQHLFEHSKSELDRNDFPSPSRAENLESNKNMIDIPALVPFDDFSSGLSEENENRNVAYVSQQNNSFFIPNQSYLKYSTCNFSAGFNDGKNHNRNYSNLYEFRDEKSNKAAMVESETIHVNCKDDSRLPSLAAVAEYEVATPPPYFHKKFDHDLERKIDGETSKEVQCYIQNCQSVLVNKLNQAFENCDNKNPLSKDNDNIIENEPVNDKPFNYKCEYCSKVFLYKQTRDTHVNNKTCSNVHRCKFCKKNFMKLYLLLRHQQERHSKCKFCCNICGKRFTSNRFLINHKGIHTKKRSFSCLRCSYKCFTASGLRTHIFEAHSSNRVSEYKCNLCGQTFKRKYGLKRHMGRRHNSESLSCKYCDKIFPCKEDISQHLKVHERYDSLICTVCEKNFASKSSLRRHNSTHTEFKNSFRCKLCSCSYTRKDTLLNHMKLHGGKMDFVCKCGKGFTKRSHFKHHAVKHAKERQFQCNGCFKRYKFKVSLKKHKCKIQNLEKGRVHNT